MKLKTFNLTNTPSVGRTQLPQIGVNIKSGLIRINKAACELMQLEGTHQIAFLQDEAEPGDWYLEIVKKDGFPVRGKINQPGLFAQSTTIVRNIFDSMSYIKLSGIIRIAKEPVKLDKRLLWPLLTTNLKN